MENNEDLLEIKVKNKEGFWIFKKVRNIIPQSLVLCLQNFNFFDCILPAPDLIRVCYLFYSFNFFARIQIFFLVFS